MKALVMDIEERKQYEANTAEELAGSASMDAKGLNESWINDQLC